MAKLGLLHITVIAFAAAFLPGTAKATFEFEQYKSLDDMRTFLASVELGTPRDAVRSLFVTEGDAALHEHPERPNIEKYLYDINLCSLYVWRWNISANYAADGRLTQIFLNGEAVHPGGETQRHAKDVGGPANKGTVTKMFRPRPEAHLGESKIAFLLYDPDPSSTAIDDEFIIGGAPSRADPGNLGVMYVYKDIERWRSIFDNESAPEIVPFAGGCPRA